MLDCHIIENKGLVAIIEIFGADFDESLTYFKISVNHWDREWKPEEKVWHVRNPDKYTHIRAIRNALNTHKKQRRMF